MIVLGLTGSIGMGKSTAGRMFRLMGVPVHDSDSAVHHALTPNAQAFEEVAVTFPEAWDKKRRMIDRKLLGAIVFQDETKRIQLEKILHPVAQKSQSDFIKALNRRGKKIAVLDIPLLFETGAERRVDYVVCVTAPHAVQRRRVLARKNMSEEKFEKILALQMPDAQKQERADFVVQTGMGFGHTFRQLAKIVRELRSR